jgi:hypothetical protein
VGDDERGEPRRVHESDTRQIDPHVARLAVGRARQRRLEIVDAREVDLARHRDHHAQPDLQLLDRQRPVMWFTTVHVRRYLPPLFSHVSDTAPG